MNKKCKEPDGTQEKKEESEEEEEENQIKMLKAYTREYHVLIARYILRLCEN